MNSPALSLAGISKTYRGRVVLDELSFVAPAGAFTGVVGPNGAGKTTALMIAVGLLRPDSGRSVVFGHDVQTDSQAAKALIGVMPDGLALPERLSGEEALTYLGLLRGLDVARVRRRTAQLLRLLELDRVAETAILNYSTGMRKKIALAIALLHHPRLLVLDEPFEAVDPISAAIITDLLDGFVKDGGSIVLSSHSMPLVEQLCEYVAVVVDGRAQASGKLDDIRAGRSLDETLRTLVQSQREPSDAFSWD
jgi:ABC-2 type transport system ATP-binding protein